MSSAIIVTVIIPMLNEEKYIEGCLKSLFKQTFPFEKMEWLLIDGMSTDKTVAICSAYADKYPIQILQNPKKKTTYALNLGIKKAKGKYIIRLDAHAEYENHYIEKCVYYLDNTDVDNVGGIAITEAKGFVGKAIGRMLASPFGVGGASFRTGRESGYVDTVPFGAFRKEIFDKVGLFNHNLPRSEDNDINARIRKAGGKIWLSNEIRFKYFCRDNIKDILAMGLKNGNALFHTFKINKQAMSIRHYVPFLFFVSIVLLPLLANTIPFVKHIIITEFLAYMLLDLYFSFVREGKYGVITLWLFPLFHIVYGIGSFIGLLGITLY